MPFKITARHAEKKWEFRTPSVGPTLLDFLQNENIPIRSACLGKGTCQQCRVQITSGSIAASNQDRKVFTDSQISDGWRLSCQIRPRSALECTFPYAYVEREKLQVLRSPQGPWTLAVDLGTTGVDAAAVDSNGVWATWHALNAQISMGSDVMTRLEYAQKHGTAPLTARAREQIQKLVQILREHDKNHHFRKSVVVSGNSAVISFLVGLPVDTLATSPFQPASLEAHSFSIGDINVETLPLLNSFVGGDLTADCFHLWTSKHIHAEPWTLVDIGTNSEILVWTGTQLFVSSTPAGPAFEGSNISIGMRAEPGAITSPQFQPSSRTWTYKVIGDDIPKGICGSGLIDFMDSAVSHSLVLVDGLVPHPDLLRLTPDLILTQADVREFQLAKSAIASGIIVVSNLAKTHPKKLLVAGAFGEHLPKAAAERLGLIPPMNSVTLGNASLQGTVDWINASQSERDTFLQWIDATKVPVDLALQDEFQDVFVKNMDLKPIHRDEYS